MHRCRRVGLLWDAKHDLQDSWKGFRVFTPLFLFNSNLRELVLEIIHRATPTNEHLKTSHPKSVLSVMFRFLEVTFESSFYLKATLKAFSYSKVLSVNNGFSFSKILFHEIEIFLTACVLPLCQPDY